MNPLSRTSPLRLVARIGHGHGWVPDGIAEVVGHTDGRFLTVSVTRHLEGRATVEVHEFDCATPDASVRAVRAWLHTLALLDGPQADVHVAAWADEAARKLLASPV